MTVHPAVAVFERHMYLYRRLWRASVFSFFVMPFMFLVSIGLGVGGYTGTVAGHDYLTWLAPGVLASTAFQIAVAESTYGILSDFEWVGGMRAMRHTRVGVDDMIAGWLLYVLAVLQLAVVAFLLVALLFGTLTSPWAPLGLLVCSLTAVSAAAPTMAFAATIRNDGYFQLLFRLIVVPVSLFSGVFFPIAQLPDLIRPLAYVSPLWHSTELNRSALIGLPSAWPVVAHVAVLLAWAALGLLWARAAFLRRLGT